MTKTDYTALDAAIRSRLDGTPCSFLQLSTNPAIAEQAEAIAKAAREAGKRTESFRVLDRRLQAMRKAGQIRFSRTEGWRIA